MIKVVSPPRGTDSQGCGDYGAPRAGGRKHNGIDIAAWPDSQVLAAVCGTVTRIGYPYDPTDPVKGHLRYVQVTTPLGFETRYFYISPLVELGDKVERGVPLGTVQDLTKVYEGMTPHVHFEVKKAGGFIHPELYLREIEG